MREINHKFTIRCITKVGQLITKIQKKRFVTCLASASPHEQRGSEGRSAGIEGIATRMGWTMVKYHSSFFSLQILF
jgi:hypothetical protein